MKRPVAKEFLGKLVGQLRDGFKRIAELEAEKMLGLEHTALREQINATIKTIEWLKEELPHPYLLIDWKEYSEVMFGKKKQFSWLGWL
jgi:hypothetical protein